MATVARLLCCVSLILLPSLASSADARFKDCADCPEMLLLPGGSFDMGSSLSEKNRSENEGPQHRVTIKPVAVGIFDVTRDEYAAFIADSGRDAAAGCYVFDGNKTINDAAKSWRNPGYPQTGRDPVVCVSWHDAQAYIAWLNQRTEGGTYRLLSEAEWEYAARAGTQTPYYWGADISREFANYGTESGALFGPGTGGSDKWDYTSPVGSFPPNAFGLFDMTGNVAQWLSDCRDSWSDNYEGAPMDGSSWTQGKCTVRALRGSSWDAPPVPSRVAGRAATMPDIRLWHVGFRVAKQVD